MRLAIMLTCFNRKEKTLRCIERLHKQKNIPQFDLFVCDDNSSDGTVKAIGEKYPNTILLEGSGSLFWSRGMYKVMNAAIEIGYDYYLMVNDDVDFFENMWILMHEPFSRSGPLGVVGCTLSQSTLKQTYGGSTFIKGKWNYYIGSMLSPSNSCFVKCDLANWNCFLINHEVIKQVGIIDPLYEHAMGDYDYSFRMRIKKINILLAKQFIGFCESNGIENSYKDSTLPRKTRVRKLFGPKGLPVKSWFYFTKSYYGHTWLRNFLVPYIKNIGCIIAGKNC
ncbi:glycosyltransferase family 2 protein [Paenibacillus koleovorans]|uniref:glycosyltransferase family 2 protein n=1 Tax=Paenibacillus koleovorans TaxID=121608 RepID=UPI0013E309C8|nr:glycosyltransferase family 2 protein [Paenibacillus koleovorans]